MSVKLAYYRYGDDILSSRRNGDILMTDTMCPIADSTGNESASASWKDHCFGWSQWLWEKHNNSASAAVL